MGDMPLAMLLFGLGLILCAGAAIASLGAL